MSTNVDAEEIIKEEIDIKDESIDMYYIQTDYCSCTDYGYDFDNQMSQSANQLDYCDPFSYHTI